MLFTAVLATLALPLAVVAQVPTSAAGISQCIIQCSTQGAAAGNCSSFADYACVCRSVVAQQVAGACLQANCTGTEVNAALQLQNATCSTLVSGSSNASASASASGSAAGSATGRLASVTGSIGAAASSAAASASARAAGAGFELASASPLLALGSAIFVGAGALLL